MRPLKLFQEAKKIPGAISMTEAVGIYDTITMYLENYHGIAVDLGSHAGKSSIIAAKALADVGYAGTMFLVDLVYDLDNPAWSQTIQGSSAKMPWAHCHKKDFKGKIKKAIGRYLEVELKGLSSLQFLAERRPISYAFIDVDDHQPELVFEEIHKIENLVVPGGLVVFHDFKNQYTAPAEAHLCLIKTSKYENIAIDWDSARAYAKKYQLEIGNDSWHMPGQEYPAFVGCARRV